MACHFEAAAGVYEPRRSGAAPTVHVIGDDSAAREGLLFALAHGAFRAAAFADALAFEHAFANAEHCDIVIVGLDRERGLAIVRGLRERHPALGIIVLAPADTPEARVRSFESGADAHLAAPVDARELAAQLHALHRRLASAAPRAAGGAWLLRQDGWILEDPRGNTLALTTAERAFVACLIAACGTAVSRDDLLERLGDNPRDADPHRIDVLVNRLRRKAAALGMQLPLHAVRGRGYMLASDTAATPVAHELARIAAALDAAPRDIALRAAPPLAPRRAH